MRRCGADQPLMLGAHKINMCEYTGVDNRGFDGDWPWNGMGMSQELVVVDERVV